MVSNKLSSTVPTIPILGDTREDPGHLIQTPWDSIDLVRYLDRVGVVLSIKSGRLDASAEPEVMADFEASGLDELREALDEHAAEVAGIVRRRPPKTEGWR